MNLRIMKLIGQIVSFLILLIIVAFNLNLFFSNPILAEKPVAPGMWVTNNCRHSGQLVEWTCEDYEAFECTGGETGQGFCP